MGLLDMLMGNVLDQPTIASDLLKDSKFAVISLAQALTETESQPLRQLLSNQLLMSIQQHHQLSDILMDKEWYRPYLAPQDQLGAEMHYADKTVR